MNGVRYVSQSINYVGLVFFSCPQKRRQSSWQRSFITSVLFLLLSVDLSNAFKISDKNNEAKSRLVTFPEWSRRRSKSSECRLGGVRHSLNSTWSPDLGPPFGVWNCVKCTCTPIKKKRRIVAKVMCKNIKNECPQISQCDNPVLLPNACCKVCPGVHMHTNSVTNSFQGEEISTQTNFGKDFAVLLNGRTSFSPLTTKRVATGRVFLQRGTLHFSFLVDAETSTNGIFTIQFLDEDRNILEEIEAQPTPYEINNGRICGTWTRIPKQYKLLLLKERMWVSLSLRLKNINTNEKRSSSQESKLEEVHISGKIKRYKGVETEVFSSLLIPVQNKVNRILPSGGIAIISVSAASDSIHISLIFNGIFGSNDERDVNIVVELRPETVQEGVKEVVKLPKIFSDVNEIEVRTTLGESGLRLLTRGRVSLRIWSTSAPELALEGTIIARATCNAFHAILTTESDSVNKLAFHRERMSTFTKFSSGWGLLFLSNEGFFQYQVRIEGVDSKEVMGILLEAPTRRKVRLIEDMTNIFVGDFEGGWINGTYDKPTYRDLDTLLRSRLMIRVHLKGGIVLSGVFETVPVTEALRTVYPTLLRSSTSWVAATAWVAVDTDCVMHYDVQVAGLDPAGGVDPTWSLILRENDTKWDPRHDQNNSTLEQIVSGRGISAHTTLLTKVSLSRLHSGVSSLELSLSSSKTSFVAGDVISGSLNHIRVPEPCLFESENKPGAKKPQEEVGVSYNCRSFGCLDAPEKLPFSEKCIDDEKNVYNDGKTWKSPMDNCRHCMCLMGTIKCETEPCPKLSCSNPIQLPGQCCPSCPVRRGPINEQFCEMSGNLYGIGSSWHPFLKPNGFDKCVTCYCNVSSDRLPLITFKHFPCSSCHESEDSNNASLNSICCPACRSKEMQSAPSPSLTPTVHPNGMLNEDLFGVVAEVEQPDQDLILQKGGCLERKKILRENDEVWYPKIPVTKAQKCVECKCKDSKITCKRLRCQSRRCFAGLSCRKKDRSCIKNKRRRLRKRNQFPCKKKKARRRLIKERKQYLHL